MWAPTSCRIPPAPLALSARGWASPTHVAFFPWPSFGGVLGLLLYGPLHSLGTHCTLYLPLQLRCPCPGCPPACCRCCHHTLAEVGRGHRTMPQAWEHPPQDGCELPSLPEPRSCGCGAHSSCISNGETQMVTAECKMHLLKSAADCSS